MADMTTHLMLDDVNLALEEPYAGSAFAIAGYVNGRYANWPAIVAKWGTSGKFLLSVDVQGVPAAGAQVLDIETGDAVISQAYAWFRATQAAGKHYRDLRWYPKLYTSEGKAKTLVDTMSAAGAKRDEWLLWTAHYTGKPHICGPNSCGCPVQADATQWTDTYEGVSLDASLCFGYFFAGPPALVTEPPRVVTPPRPVEVTVPHVEGSTVAKAVEVLTAAGLRASLAATVEGVVTAQAPKAGAMAPKGSIVVLIAEVPKPPAPVEVTVPNVVGVEVTKAVVTLQAADLKVADNSGGPIPSTGTVTGIDPAVGAKVAKGSTVVIAVKAPTATVAPPPPASPPAPVVKVPEPSPSPVAPPTGKPAVMVYVQETLTAEFASKLGLPPGTILFIPHKVEGA